MTYTEIIDNIQTRIENLISERLAGTYQHITIEPSNYNPQIDDEITVTITVTDQNDDPIPNWTVPLQINGTAITGTITTNNNGVATYTHTCNEWGTTKFSVKSYTCQINVTGFKTITLNQGTLYYDNEKVQYVLNYNGSGTYNFSQWTDSGAFGTIPSELRPTQPIYSSLGSSLIRVRVNHTTGKVQYITTQSVTDPYFQCVLTWLLP